MSSTACTHRIVQDGVHHILPYMSKRVIRSGNELVFKKLIISRYNEWTTSNLGEDAQELIDSIESLALGCFVFVFKVDGECGVVRQEALTMFKFKNAMSTMISKE